MCLLARTENFELFFGQKSKGKMKTIFFTPLPKIVETWKSKPRGSFFEAHLPITSKTPELLQNRTFADFPTICFPTKVFVEISFTNFCFRCRKMKCRGSSETRFPRVWGRTEPSSGGKRPFENSIFLAPKNFERLKNREDSSDFDDFWTKLIASTRSAFRKNFRASVFEKFSRKLRENFAKRGRWHARSAEKF